MANYYVHHHQMESVPFDAGYDSSSDASVSTPWDSFQDDLLRPFNYGHSLSPSSATSTGTPNTPAMEAARPTTSRTSSSSSIKTASSKHPTSAPETEEERRKNRKREQNRESQRAFRRRQENRVKFLENKTLELETSSRQLRADNEQLRVALIDARTRNDELVTHMNMMHLTPSPLNLAQDVVPSIENDNQQYYRHSHSNSHREVDPRVVW